MSWFFYFAVVFLLSFTAGLFFFSGRVYKRGTASWDHDYSLGRTAVSDERPFNAHSLPSSGFLVVLEVKTQKEVQTMSGSMLGVLDRGCSYHPIGLYFDRSLTERFSKAMPEVSRREEFFGGCGYLTTTKRYHVIDLEHEYRRCGYNPSLFHTPIFDVLYEANIVRWEQSPDRYR